MLGSTVWNRDTAGASRSAISGQGRRSISHSCCWFKCSSGMVFLGDRPASMSVIMCSSMREHQSCRAGWKTLRAVTRQSIIGIGIPLMPLLLIFLGIRHRIPEPNFATRGDSLFPILIISSNVVFAEAKSSSGHTNLISSSFTSEAVPRPLLVIFDDSLGVIFCSWLANSSLLCS